MGLFLLLLILSCTSENLVATIGENETVGDFAPLSIGNEWVYKSESGGMGGPYPNKYSTVITMTVLDSTMVGDTTVYTLRFHEKGENVVSWIPQDTVITSTIDSVDTFKVSEVYGMFTKTILYNLLPIPFFRMHFMEKKDVRMADSEFEWKSDSATYRTNIGLKNYYIVDSYPYLWISTRFVELTLQSFNSNLVALLE